MTHPVLEAREVGGADAPALDLSIAPGSGLIMVSSAPAVLDEVLEVLFGLEGTGNDQVLLNGQCVGRCGERVLLERLDALGYAAERGGLIGNLKMWENLLLPRDARKGREDAPPTEELEARALEAFAVASVDEERAVGLMPRTPDQLSRFERIVCALVRCHLAGFRLLVCDRIFEGIDGSRSRRVARLVDWLGERHEGSALLVLHHSSHTPEDRFGLRGWKPVDIMNLEEGSWLAS